MYEAQTYELILKRMLDRVDVDLDKREGSIIYDALSPAAAELAQAYAGLEINLRLFSAQTSSGDYLEYRTADYGVTRKAATKALRKALFFGKDNLPLEVAVGSRFSIEKVNYQTMERISTGQYSLECEIAGSRGNQNFGTMLPIDFISGLVRAELVDILIPGVDTESDDELRKRYLQRVRQPATSGNAAQYRQWATEVPGVGDAKVFPLWAGPGTVKLAIVDTEKQPASLTLVDEVMKYLETVRPIGAAVTVVSAAAKGVNVSAGVVLASGYAIQAVTDAFSASMEAYLQEMAFTGTYVSYAKVGTLLLSTPGIIDYVSLTLNNGNANVALRDEEIPVLGTVGLGV
ncbi:baseplate J/gp47 family protein [Desulfosporosinus meridiei]|uniref:Putative phage Mu protein gp47-like protein n=1 Tax=Desulfosporosinus meridiei (strain ATCC BAA-275 / DSM 13257 / KCTC 12902 / NCIMB 13706 / S10) TaxID=768704 RepID=J7ITV8_DESMD|nr:baseplate J/gp47 family protein [Desulfosporosinus meridiei]AFQ45150.1 putative phage Mu protein gp47-like protein [Desulfosporosinus meridiei DSM 13257]